MCTERKATGEYVLSCFLSATMGYNTHTLTPLKRGTSCLIIKLKIGPSCLGPSFESWAELAWADFYVGRVGMGRVGFGPSCPAPFHTPSL